MLVMLVGRAIAGISEKRRRKRERRLNIFVGMVKIF